MDTIEDDANRMEMGSVVNIALNSSASEAHTSTAILSTFRAPRHQFSIKKSLRRPLQQTTIPPGASAVLASREAAEKKMATTGGGLTEWLAQYFAKVSVGLVLCVCVLRVYRRSSVCGGRFNGLIPTYVETIELPLIFSETHFSAKLDHGQ